MTLVCRNSQPQERDQVAQFLAAVFDTSLSAPFLSPDLLTWKYYGESARRVGRRSFVLESEGEIIAHAGLCPVTYDTEDGEIRGAHLIDWAGSRKAPGSGVHLLRMLLERVDFLLTVGGSAATRAILPRIGYQQRGQAEIYARVLRPWKQAARRPHRQSKDVLRLARNVAWNAAPSAAVVQPWSWKPVVIDSEVVRMHAAMHFGGFLVPKRTAAMLHDMLACPGAAVRAFLLEHAGEPRGYFLMSRLLGQARVVEMFVGSESQDDWRTGFAAVTASAAADPEACEIVAQSTVPMLAHALRESGFRERLQQPVFILDPAKKLPAAATLSIQMMDGDAAFLAIPEAPFLT